MSDTPLTPEQIREQQAQARAQRAAMFARPSAAPVAARPAATASPTSTTSTTTTSTTSTAPAPMTTPRVAQPTTTTTTTTATHSASTIRPPTLNNALSSGSELSTTSAPSRIQTTTNTSSIPSFFEISTQQNVLLPTSAKRPHASGKVPPSSPLTPTAPQKLDWEKILQQWTHDVIRHTFQITTDSDVLQTALLDQKTAKNRESGDAVGYSLSSNVQQLKSSVELEQKAGYMYLPLVSRAVLGEFVSHGLSHSCSCSVSLTPTNSTILLPSIESTTSTESSNDNNNDNIPRPALALFKTKQSCDNCRQQHPLLTVQHLEAIFGEINSLMHGYQPLPAQLTHTKPLLADPPSIEDCFATLINLINGSHDDITSHASSIPRSTCLDSTKINGDNKDNDDFTPAPLVELDQPRITYHQQSAMLIGSLSAQALSAQLKTNKVAQITPQNTTILPSFVKSPSSPPQSRSTSLSTTEPQSMNTNNFEAIDKLISNIQFSPSLSLSSPLSTLFHILYNAHNATLRSKNLLAYFLSCYNRIQALYEYISSFCSVSALGGVSVGLLVTKLNKLIDNELANIKQQINEKTQADQAASGSAMSDADDYSKYNRSSSAVVAAAIAGAVATQYSPEQQQMVNFLNSKKIELSSISAQALGSAGDLLHVVRSLAAKYGISNNKSEDDPASTIHHTLAINEIDQKMFFTPSDGNNDTINNNDEHLTQFLSSLLSIDFDQNANIYMALTVIAKNNLLTAEDYAAGLTTANSTEKLNNTKYKQSSQLTSFLGRNLDQTAHVGASANTLYSMLQHPGLLTPADLATQFAASSPFPSSNGITEMLFTQNQDSSDAYFTSLICPLIPALTAGIVNHVIPNQSLASQSTANTTVIADIVDPSPIFALVHSLISVNGLVPARTSKGISQLPMVMFINTLLSTLTTISQRIVSAIGEILLAESDTALNTIHLYFNHITTLRRFKKKEISTDSNNDGAGNIHHSIADGSNTSANVTMYDSATNTPTPPPHKEIDLLMTECLRVLYEKAPNYTYFIQCLQSDHIKHQFGHIMWGFDHALAQPIARHVQNLITTGTSSELVHTMPNGKKLKLPQRPFQFIAAQKHDFSMTTAVLAAYGLHRPNITNQQAPLSFESGLAFSLTRALPTFTSNGSNSGTFSPTETVQSTPGQQPLSLEKRLPAVSTANKLVNVSLSHNLRRKFTNSGKNTNFELDDEKRSILMQYPRVAQYLIGVCDELETDSLHEMFLPNQNIPLHKRSQFNYQLYLQNYRYTTVYTVHSTMADVYLKNNNTQKRFSGATSLVSGAANTLVLNGCPVHISPLPMCLMQGISDVLEGGFHRVSSCHFDIDFISSIYTINVGNEVRVENLSFPPSRSNYGKNIANANRSNNLLQQRKLAAKGSIKTSTSPTPDTSPVLLPVAAPNQQLSSPTGASSLNHRVLKHSSVINAFSRQYALYRHQIEERQTQSSTKRGSVVLAHVTYPIISYFILTLMHTDTIRRNLVSKEQIPLDVVDSCDAYECVYQQWSPHYLGTMYTNSQLLAKDRELSLQQFQAQKASVKSHPLQQPEHNEIYVLNKVLLQQLDLKENILPLLLHENNAVKTEGAGSNHNSKRSAGSGAAGDHSRRNAVSALVCGTSFGGYDAQNSPNFVLVGLAVVEALAKHHNSDSAVLNVAALPLPHSALSQIFLHSLAQLPTYGQLLTITTPASDKNLRNQTGNTSGTQTTVVNSNIPESLSFNPSNATIFPIFPTLRPTSIAFATTILRGLLSLTATQSIIALVLAHPGFAPMYNALAIPKVEITHRVLQWVHLKYVLDLSNLQSTILYPLVNQTGLPLDQAPQPTSYSPSVSASVHASRMYSQNSNASGNGYDYGESDGALASISSLMSIPSAIRTKLSDLSLPALPSLPKMNFGLSEIVSATLGSLGTSQGHRRKKHLDSENNTSSEKGTISSSLQTMASTISGMHQFTGSSLLDAIMPFLNSKTFTAKPTTSYPISLSNSMKSGKLFSSSSLFGLLYAVYPDVCDDAFLNLQKRHYQSVDKTMSRIRSAIKQYTIHIEGLSERILRADNLTRRRWLDFNTQYAQRSIEYRKMHPNEQSVPPMGGLLNFMGTLLTHVQPIIKQQPQPIHLTLVHALEELGLSTNNLAVTTLFHEITSKSGHNVKNGQNHGQLLRKFTTSLNTIDYYPGKIELDYMLRFDDADKHFKLQLPPHIFYHLKKHFSPMSLDELEVQLLQQQRDEERQRTMKQQVATLSNAGNSKIASVTAKPQNKKNSLVSLLASSASGINDLARSFLDLDPISSDDDDEEEDDDIPQALSEPVAASGDNVSAESKEVAKLKTNTTYLSLMYHHVTEILGILSFFAENSCECGDDHSKNLELYIPTPCHSRKALLSLQTNPWLVPSSVGAGVNNLAQNSGNADILHDIVQQHQQEQQALRDSELLESVSTDSNTMICDHNTADPSYFASPAQSTGPTTTASPQQVPQITTISTTIPITPPQQSASIQSPQENINTTALFTQNTLRAIPKFIFKLTDICSQCGLLLKTPSSTTAASHTMNTLTDLRSKIHQTLSTAAPSSLLTPCKKQQQRKPLDTLISTVSRGVSSTTFAGAKQLGLWMMLGNSKFETKQSTHCFNVLILQSDDDSIEEDAFIEGVTDVSAIESVESCESVVIDGKDVEVNFTTYFVPASVVLQATINGNFAHIVNLAEKPFSDVDPFKINKKKSTVSTTTTTTDSSMTDADTDINPAADKNEENYPVVICHDLDKQSDMNEAGLDIDPSVIAGLIALFNKTEFSRQQATYQALLDEELADSDDGDKNIMTDDVAPTTSVDDDKKNIKTMPGSQYIHCAASPPYDLAPTRYVRYFELERLFHHSAPSVNNIRQLQASKLFMLSAQKSHELTLLQVNTFLNRQYSSELDSSLIKGHVSKRPMSSKCTKNHFMLTQAQQDSLYDSLYGYNLMLHLSQYFSEQVLIQGLDSSFAPVKEYTDLPQILAHEDSDKSPIMSDSTQARKIHTDPYCTSQKIALNKDKTIDQSERQNALGCANPAVSTTLYSFRTELLCLTLEALHLGLPTIIRSFQDAQDNIRRIDEEITYLTQEKKEFDRQYAEFKSKLETVEKVIADNRGQMPPGLDYAQYLRLKQHVSLLAKHEGQFIAQLEQVKRRKVEVNGQFGRTKMILSDPAFISRVLTVYNWVCTFILSCIDSSCVYCRDSTPDDNANDGEKVIIALLARNYQCTCARTMVGIVPEYWVHDVWQWLTVLNGMRDPTLRVLCQTNALDSLLLLALTTVGTLSNKKSRETATKQADKTGKNTTLINKSNIGAMTANSYQDLVDIISLNKAAGKSSTNNMNDGIEKKDDKYSYEIDTATLRTLLEYKSEIEYDQIDEDEHVITEKYTGTFNVLPKIDLKMSVNLNINKHAEDLSMFLEYKEQQYNDYGNNKYEQEFINTGLIHTHQFTSYPISCLNPTTYENISTVCAPTGSGHIVYFNHYSPLFVSLSSHLSHYITKLDDQLPHNSDIIEQLYPLIEFKVLSSLSQHTTEKTPAYTPYTNIASSELPAKPNAIVRSILRQPLQIYLVSLLNAFLPTIYNDREEAMMKEYESRMPAHIEQTPVIKNILHRPTALLSQFPYCGSQRIASTSTHIPHYSGAPSNPVTTALLAQADIIPIKNGTTHYGNTTLIFPGTPASSKTLSPSQGMANQPHFSTETYKQYASRHMRQLAKDKDGHVSPGDISWWPMQYLALDSAVHPFWRTGQQSNQIVPLLCHLYANTASVESVEVTTEQDRHLIWMAQREKHQHKKNLVELFVSLLLSEEEADCAAKKVTSQGVPDKGDGDDYSYIVQCNNNLLQYESFRQNSLRQRVLEGMIDDYKAKYPSWSNVDLYQQLVRDWNDDPHFTVDNTDEKLSFRLPIINRLPNGHCYCGCACFGCGCGYDYKNYANLTVPAQYRALHVPPSFTTCICGPHTKSLTRLAIETTASSASSTSSQSRIYAQNGPTNTIQYQQTMQVALYSLLVEQFNSTLDEDMPASEQTMSDENTNKKHTFVINPQTHHTALALQSKQIDIQFPLFDRFIHVLCNDISFYMEDTLRSLAEIKEREVKGIRITEEDVERWDRENSENAQNAQNVAPPNADAPQPAAANIRPTSDRDLHAMTFWNSHYSNLVLLLLNVICLRGKLALLRPEFSNRIAVIIGGYLHKLTNPSQTKLVSVAPAIRTQLKFSPKHLIGLFINILSSLSHVGSGLSIQQLTNNTFTIQHPLSQISTFLQLLPTGTLSQDNDSAEVQNMLKYAEATKDLSMLNNEPLLGGIAMIKSLSHRDAKFSTSEFNHVINILLKTGTLQQHTALETSIIESPLSIVLHSIKSDFTKHNANYNAVKHIHYTTAAVSNNNTNSGEVTVAPHLITYGVSHDDKSRAISRCQARAVGVIQLYTKLNALHKCRDPTMTQQKMLQQQNNVTQLAKWSWLYSNPSACTIAHVLHQYASTKPPNSSQNHYVEELGLAWWPLPPLTTPILVSLFNALKGDHEWDAYLNLTHFCPSNDTIAALNLRDETHFKLLIEQHSNLILTPQNLEVLYPAAIIPQQVSYYTRGIGSTDSGADGIITSEFWLRRVGMVFDLYGSLVAREECLLGTQVDSINESAPIDMFNLPDDDDDGLEVPDDFKDDCFWDIMQYPVQLHGSKAKIEWLSLYRSLLTSTEDPFNRQPLDVNSILPLPHIQYAIKLYKMRKGVF